MKCGVREGIFKVFNTLTQSYLIISYCRKLYWEAWEMGRGEKEIPLGYFSCHILLDGENSGQCQLVYIKLIELNIIYSI